MSLFIYYVIYVMCNKKYSVSKTTSLGIYIWIKNPVQFPIAHWLILSHFTLYRTIQNNYYKSLKPLKEMFLHSLVKKHKSWIREKNIFLKMIKLSINFRN